VLGYSFDGRGHARGRFCTATGFGIETLRRRDAPAVDAFGKPAPRRLWVLIGREQQHALAEAHEDTDPPRYRVRCGKRQPKEVI